MSGVFELRTKATAHKRIKWMCMTEPSAIDDWKLVYECGMRLKYLGPPRFRGKRGGNHPMIGKESLKEQQVMNQVLKQQQSVYEVTNSLVSSDSPYPVSAPSHSSHFVPTDSYLSDPLKRIKAEQSRERCGSIRYPWQDLATTTRADSHRLKANTLVLSQKGVSVVALSHCLDCPGDKGLPVPPGWRPEPPEDGPRSIRAAVRHGTVAGIFFSPEVTRKIKTVEPKEQQTVVQKVEQAGEMLQTVPRVPVAGVRRRWGNRHTGSLQESSPEVSSSGVLSPPPNFQPSTPESAAVKNEELQLWDLDLHRGLQTNGDHYRATITATTTTTVLPTVTDPASPFTTPLEGLCL
ncbi:hypothetical protein WN48_06625 [Eufriesea mexicana]|uniref:Uncharacterized protein n=1 Tax=Eufriesea mexicana TaxID=516756 RepID=A0A310SPG3_9HYME|nr:hypothetical protein WN48_06625 [Eufriesea mexicana]